jgi:type I restriction enzyme S subunit
MTPVVAYLAEVATIERSSVDPTGIPDGAIYVGLENITSDGKFVDVRAVSNGELKSSKFRFDDGHVLYGKLRPYLAKIAAPDFSGVCSTDILPIRPGPALDRRYLLQFLRTPQMVGHAAQLAVGINLPRLSPKVLATFEVPLPPIEEQQRIAAILDAADALRANRRQALAKLDSLNQTVFDNMFGDLANNSRGWPLKRMSEFVDYFETGKSVAASTNDAPSGYRVLKVSAVTSRHYVPEESKPVPVGYEPSPHHIVRAGDLLLSRANTTDLVGACAYVDITPSNHLLPDKLWRFVWRKPKSVEPLFVWKLLQGRRVRKEIGDLATGSSGSMKNISQKKFMSLVVPVPPLNLQKRFVASYSEAQRVRLTQRQSLHSLDSLFTSLQQQAFRGEL